MKHVIFLVILFTSLYVGMAKATEYNVYAKDCIPMHGVSVGNDKAFIAGTGSALKALGIKIMGSGFVGLKQKTYCSTYIHELKASCMLSTAGGFGLPIARWSITKDDISYGGRLVRINKGVNHAKVTYAPDNTQKAKYYFETELNNGGWCYTEVAAGKTVDDIQYEPKMSKLSVDYLGKGKFAVTTYATSEVIEYITVNQGACKVRNGKGKHYPKTIYVRKGNTFTFKSCPELKTVDIISRSGIASFKF